MKNDNIIFDDWETRYDRAYEKRRKDYIICSLALAFLLVFSAVLMFFEFAMIFVFILIFIVILVIYLEWLKVKNNHLIIKTDQIEITDRFSKVSIYKIDFNNLVIEIEHTYKRGGGIVMRFYDLQFKYIARYEDMLNCPTPYGEKRNQWEEKLKNLGKEIIDNSEIIKN